MVKIVCVCPPTADGQTRHPQGDTVELRERLGFHAATSARQALRVLYMDDPNTTAGETLAAFTEQYLIHGIEKWSLVDEAGDPLPPSRPNIRQFMEDHTDAAMEVGDAADALYSEAVLLPLVNRGLSSSPDTQTGGSTSPPTGLTIRPLTPFSPSSTTTSETDDTETTTSSPDGDSSSSPKWASVV